MSTIWDRFEGIVKAEEVVEAKIQAQPVEEGNYEATLSSAEAGETKSNLPAMKLLFTLGSGKRVYVTQVLQNLNYPHLTSLNIAKACELIEEITGEAYEFTSLSDMASKIEELPVGSNFIIEVSYEARDVEKKYAKVRVLEKVDLIAEDDGDVPF